MRATERVPSALVITRRGVGADSDDNAVDANDDSRRRPLQVRQTVRRISAASDAAETTSRARYVPVYSPAVNTQ